MAILVFIQSKRLVTANEIADRFETSLRTVYRDVKALEETGIPIIGEAGRGYSIQSGYHLPPVMFTREEAAAMLTAGKMTEKLTDSSLNKHYCLAMEKVKAVIRYNDKEFLEVLDNHILVLQPPTFSQTNFPNNFLTTIQQALTKRLVINLEYYASYNSEVTRRLVEPVGICFYSSRWHLIAFCKLRNEYRDFRIDRIKQLTLTQENYGTNHGGLNEKFPYMGKIPELTNITVRFEKEVAAALAEQKYYYGFVSETELENFTEMSFMVTTINWFCNWLLSFGNKVQIISPPEILDYLKNMVNELNKHYN